MKFQVLYLDRSLSVCCHDLTRLVHTRQLITRLVIDLAKLNFRIKRHKDVNYH